MITQIKESPESEESDPEDSLNDKVEEAIKPGKHLPNLKRESKEHRWAIGSQPRDKWVPSAYLHQLEHAP